jgi:hypothetical protein
MVTPMDRDKIVEIWKQYGKTYNVFVPDDQPMPKGEEWDRPVPEVSDTGTIDPQLMKHWRLFQATKGFLRHKYAQYGILRGPGLTFDCLVPQFQKPMKMSMGKKGRKKGDPKEWYAGAMSMLITAHGEVAFTCSSRECPRTKCKLNLRNPKRKKVVVVDVFSLIRIFHGYRSVVKAKQTVAEGFEVRLGHFEFRGIEEKTLMKRLAVPKWAIDELIQRFSGIRRQQIPSLVHEAVELVGRSQVIGLEHGRVFSNYFAFLWPQIIDNQILQKINGGGIRLYLWLLREQEERARRNEFAMSLTDKEVAGKIGASQQTIGRYRQELEKLGVLKVKGNIWAVGYTCKSQWNR